MKLICLVGILGLSAVACHREEETASGGGPSKRKLPVKAGEEAEAVPGSKTAKASDRAKTKKPIPMAEPVPGRPGFVKSPYSSSIIDATLIPAGTVVADPRFPAEEEKLFRVPVMMDLAASKEDEAAAFPSAASVQGKPGFIINPYTNREFDASNLEPGTAIVDPSGLPDETRIFQVPLDHVRREQKEPDQ